MGLLTEIITQAHMAGQHHAGCKHPSWGDALGHTHTILPETIDRAARQHIEESQVTAVEHLKAEIRSSLAKFQCSAPIEFPKSIDVLVSELRELSAVE